MGKNWPALDVYAPACDPQLQELVLAELDDFQPTAIEERDDPPQLRAFFNSLESRDDAARALGAAFAHHLVVEKTEIEDDDWAARSQLNLRAIRVGQLVIAPPWDVPGVPVPSEKRGTAPFPGGSEKGAVPLFPDSMTTIVIRPSTGFGTGHHATTRLALKALQLIAIADRRVLDIGCGSGVLAISAARLGARSAVGIDIDDDALANAGENVELNRAGDRVRFQLMDFHGMSDVFDVVLANLTGALLERSASKLKALLEPGGCLIASGFMESETDVVSKLKKELSLQNLEREEGWMCGTFLNLSSKI